MMHQSTIVVLLLVANIDSSSGFVVPSRRSPSFPATKHDITLSELPRAFPIISSTFSSSTSLQMSSSDEGGGIVTKIVLAGVLVLFLASSLLPFLSEMGADGGRADLSAAVVTRQDGDQYKNNERQFDKLSRAKIQEKLSRVPVFFLVDKVSGRMAPEIYCSYEDAVDASKFGDGYLVKATTLNQVVYPLVLKRGRMMMPPPPDEVAKAEDEIRSEEGGAPSSDTKFKLIPSKQALQDAADAKLDLAESDLPLFVADRLAFAAAAGGAQVPLFFERDDALTSYNRLREQGGGKLPEVANIRTTTLMDELNSMEKGTRPGVKQLEFYANANDLMRADALMGN